MAKKSAGAASSTAGPFGRLLRYWRTTFAMSQEELALETGVSPRHVSFLETGRSQPGRTMVLNLAQVFNLSEQDVNTLLVAAGFAADRSSVDLGAKGMGWLRNSLQLTLRAYEPFAAMVMDHYGKVHMVNRGFLSLYGAFIKPEHLQGPLNGYHLYFSEHGLRPHLVDWEDTACRLLVTLQQEMLLGGDEEAQRIVEELLEYASIPGNWSQRGAEIPHMHSFRIRLRFPDGSIHPFFNIVNTVGATPYVSEPRLLVSLMMPENPEDLPPLEDGGTEHPLLPY